MLYEKMNTLIGHNSSNVLLSDYIMFNLGNTNSYLKESKLQAILKIQLKTPKRNHRFIIDKNQLTSCCLYGFRKICSNCGEFNANPVFCSDKNLCAICNSKYSNKRGLKIYETFALFDTEYMIHAVLTTPKGYFSEELDKFDTTNKLHALALEWKDENFGKKASGKFVVHTNSTKDPLGPPHFHIHILISDKKYYPIHQNDLSKKKYLVGFGKKEVHVYQENLQKLRDSWKNILGSSEEVNFHYQYSKLERKKRFWCKYICRDSIYDINEFLLKQGKNYKLSPQEEENYAYQIQNKKYFKRIRSFGYYSNSKIADLHYIMHGKNIQNAYRKINFIEICSNCGAILPEEIETTILIQKNTRLSILIDELEYEKFIKRLRKVKKK